MVAILTNQNNMGTSSGSRLAIFKFQVEALIAEVSLVTALISLEVDKILQLQFGVAVYCAVRQDMYRKPRPDMWNQLLSDFNINQSELVDSFYVGDSAGRPTDRSACDR